MEHLDEVLERLNKKTMEKEIKVKCIKELGGAEVGFFYNATKAENPVFGFECYDITLGSRHIGQFIGAEIEEYFEVVEEDKEESFTKHYDNTKGSLYKFTDEHELNSYEFDIIKRVMRCRKKGEFLKDLEKTKFLIDLYIREQSS